MKNRFTHENLVMQVWGSTLLSIVLSIAMPLISHGSVGLLEFIAGFIVSFIVSLVLKLFTPVIEIGQQATTKLGVAQHTLKHRLISSFFLTLLLGTTMSLIMTWWGIHALPNCKTIFLQSWLKEYPWVLLIVYVMINVSIPSGAIVANVMLSPTKENANSQKTDQERQVL